MITGFDLEDLFGLSAWGKVYVAMAGVGFAFLIAFFKGLGDFRKSIEYLQLAIITTIVICIVLIISLASAEASTAVPHSKVIEYCKYYKYRDCNLISAIVKKEASYLPGSINPEDDDNNKSYGLMQVRCKTAKDMGLKYSCAQLNDPQIGIRFGIKYVQFLEKTLKTHSPRHIVAAYNAGFRRLCDGRGDCQYVNRTCQKFKLLRWKDGKTRECYPGEFINQEHVWKTLRHYKYLVEKDETRSTTTTVAR